jgi:hypothetical protein
LGEEGNELEKQERDVQPLHVHNTIGKIMESQGQFPVRASSNVRRGGQISWGGSTGSRGGSTSWSRGVASFSETSMVCDEEVSSVSTPYDDE